MTQLSVKILDTLQAEYALSAILLTADYFDIHHALMIYLGTYVLSHVSIFHIRHTL